MSVLPPEVRRDRDLTSRDIAVYHTWIDNMNEYREDPNKKYKGCVQKGHNWL